MNGIKLSREYVIWFWRKNRCLQRFSITRVRTKVEVIDYRPHNKKSRVQFYAAIDITIHKIYGLRRVCSTDGHERQQGGYQRIRKTILQERGWPFTHIAGQPVRTCVAVVAEISLRPLRKLFMFTIENKQPGSTYSRKKRILEKKHWCAPSTRCNVWKYSHTTICTYKGLTKQYVIHS